MTTQTLTRTQTDTQQDTPKKRLFTRKEYHSMGKAGIFAPNERVELLEGEIIVMLPVGNRHFTSVLWLTDIFSTSGRLAGRAGVIVRNPIVASPTSEPEPDLMLLTLREDRYAFGKPRPQDVLLLIEVADSSLHYDLNVKLPHYAAIGIPEVWIANLQDDRIESYMEPSPEGYRASGIHQLGDAISPTAFPDLEIAVNDIIPPRPPEPACPQEQ